jgi:hypothetical protein
VEIRTELKCDRLANEDSSPRLPECDKRDGGPAAPLIRRAEADSVQPVLVRLGERRSRKQALEVLGQFGPDGRAVGQLRVEARERRREVRDGSSAGDGKDAGKVGSDVEAERGGAAAARERKVEREGDDGVSLPSLEKSGLPRRL